MRTPDVLTPEEIMGLLKKLPEPLRSAPELDASTGWRRYGKPAVKAAEIKKRVAFHTFWHTYTTLLAQNTEGVKVVQELLRRANSRVTLDLYAQAGMQEKHKAN